MTAEELAKSPVIRMAGSDGHIYETTADRAHEMADAARQEGVALKPFLKTEDAEGNVHEISPFDGEGLKTAQDRGDVQHFDEVNEDYFSAEALKAGATRFAIGLVNPLDWIKGVGTAAGTVAKGFVKGTVGTVLGAARGATYLGESITNAIPGVDDHTVSDAIGGVNSGMNKWLDILFEDVYASTGEYDGVEGAKKATGAVRNVAELVANVKGIGSITKGLAASEAAAAKAAGVVDTAKAAAAGMKVAHTATGALFGLGKYADVASDPNGPGGARQQAAALVAGSADAVFFGLWNPLKVSQKYAQEMSPFMDATRKEIMKRVMVKVGQAAESGATMALVEAVKQGAEQVASIGTEKAVSVDDEGNEVKNWAARTLKESALEVGTQFLVGSAFVALDVAEQEMGRFGYNRARKAQGEVEEGLSDKMKVAMSYQVERNRRAYAPERDRQARFALQAKLQPELGSANEAYKYSPDVKAVNEDGSVTFKDGSVWRLDPRMEGGATITVSDGTILSESGELLGYRARQESGAQVRADERGKTDADAQVRAASNSLVLLQQIDEGALPIKEVELAAVEPIAPTENGGIIEVWDPQKYKPIVVLEDLEGNLKALTGGKRILAAKGEGLEKLRAVVVREADGWTAEEASKLSATENLRQGLGTLKNVVEAVDSLGEEDVLQLAGWHQANGSREFASTLRRGLKFARNATPELRAALEDGRISDEFAANAAGVLSMERLGENWQAAQKAVTDLVGNVGQEELEAVLWGVQKKLSGKAATPEEIAAAVQECREEFNRKHGGAEGTLDSDTTLVETGKNELKTIGEVESGMEGNGEGSHAETQSRGETEPLYAAAEAAKGNKAVELKPIAGSDGTFTTLAFPDAKIKIDGERKVIAVDGLTVDDFAGMKVTDAAALVASVEAKAAELGLDIGFYDDGVRTVWEGVKAKIKAEGAAAHERQQLAEKSGTVVDMLQKSFPDAKLHKTAEEWAAAQKKYGYELKDAEGEIYGFTDPATGDIYLNPDYFGTRQALEAPIHEYGHLGIIATKKVNKAVYDRGMKLANDFLDKPETAGDGAVRRIVDFILSDPEYSKQSRALQCEELLAQLIGKRGEEALRAETNKTVVGKIKSWLVEFWNTFGKALGLKEITPEQAEKMTVEEVADAIRAEMFSGRKYGEGLKGVEFADGGARAVTKPVRVKRKLTGRRKAVNDFVKLMGGAEDPANYETDMLALWVDNGGRLFDKLPFEIETGYSKGASGVKATRRAVADEFAESTAFYKDLDPAQRKVFFGSDKLEMGAIGEGLKNKLQEAGITRFTREDGTVDYDAAIDEFKRQWTNYERGERFLKERDEWQEERDRAYVEEMERAEAAEREAERAANDEISAEEAAGRAEMEAADAAADAQIAEDIAAGRFSRKGGELLFSRFAGEKGAENMGVGNANHARSMESAGADREKIWRETGWWKGKDGKWRFELPSARMKGEKELEAALLKGVNDLRGGSSETTLEKVLDAPELFKSYPQLKDTKIVFSPEHDDKTGGWYDKEKNEIVILDSGFTTFKHLTKHDQNLYNTYQKVVASDEFNQQRLRNMDALGIEHGTAAEEREYAKKWIEKLGKRIQDDNAAMVRNLAKERGQYSTFGKIVHEVQHAVQDIEGFAKGGNPESAAALVKSLERKQRIWLYKLSVEETAKELGTTNPYKIEKAIFEELGATSREQVAGLEAEGWIPDKAGRDKGYNLFARGYDKEGYEEAYDKYLGEMQKNNSASWWDGSPNELYNRLAGEVEARNASRREAMTPEQRAATPPWATEDVPRERQLLFSRKDNAVPPSALGDGKQKYYEVPFDKAVDKIVANGKPKSDEGVFVSATPDVFTKIGFARLPIMMTQNHILSISSNAKVMRQLGFNPKRLHPHDMKSVLKQVPGALKKPLMIIASDSHPDTSVVAITQLTDKNGNSVIAPILIGGKSTVGNQMQIDAHIMTSAHGRDNAWSKLVAYALDQEAKGNVGVFYIDNTKASVIQNQLARAQKSLPSGASGLQLPQSILRSSSTNLRSLVSRSQGADFVHSIADPGSPVNASAMVKQTGTRQFKNWFRKGKFVDANGEPLVLYHETGNDFTVFDPRHAGAGGRDYETPFGIFLKPSPAPLGLARGWKARQMALYANVQNPIQFSSRRELGQYLRKNCKGYAEAVDAIKNIDADYGKRLEAAEKVEDEAMKDIYRNHHEIWNDDARRMEMVEKYGAEPKRILDEWKVAADKQSAALKEVTDKFFRSSGHDGIVIENDEGSFGRRTKTYIALNPNQVKSATDNIGTFDPGNPDVRFARGTRPEAKYVKLTRVADDAGAGEQTPGALAASRELSRQGATPLTTRGTRYVSLPLSEMNALARYLTGHAMPAEMSTGRKLGVPGKASTKHRKLFIAADVVGSIDKTDAAKETATLKQHGFFRNEDPNWVANHSPVEVRQERERSEEALATRLEALADRRAKGTEPGGMSAGRKVFADQLAKIVMSMPHGQPGVLGAMQTVGGALERRVRGNDAEADAFLDWMEGAAQPVQRSPQDRKAGMFGAFLTMPKEMEQRARGWYDAIRSTIAGDQKLADAFRKMTVRSMTEQGYAHLEQEILRAQSAQTEQALKKLREESNAPIAAGGLKDRALETVVLSCDDRMGAALVRVDASVKLYLAAQKKLMASAPDAATKSAIKQQTDLFMGAIAQAKNQAELSRTAWERGHNNADARYLYRMVDLLNEATVRDGLKMEDVSLYLDQQRVIETKGLSGSRGESARQAQLILDAMKRRLGAADYAKVEAFARKFAAIHEQELLNDPVLERILGKGTVDYWRGNTHYVTTKRQFSPEELAEIEAARAAVRAANGGKGDDVVGEMFKFAGRAGMDTGAAKATARLKGSFSDKQEVMSATFEKVAAIKRWLRRCEYVIELRDLLKLAKVEGVHDFAAGEAKFPDNSRYGHITYMENGRKRVLVVPKEIADGFKAQREFDTPALKLCASVNNIARQLWIDWNPVYWQRNIGRNVGSIEMNMPGMKESAIKRGLRFVFPGLAPTTEIALTHLVRHMPEKMSLPLRKIWGEHTALFYAPKAKRMAMWLTDHNEMQKRLWEAQDRGDLGTVQEMLQDQRDMLDALRGNMLVGISAGKAGGTTAFLDDSVRTVGKTMARELQEMQAKPKWRRALDAANIFSKNAKQQVFEDVMAKFAAYLHDRAQFGTGNNRSVAESGLAVKKNVSIGEGERKGKDTRAVQAIFQPFWNMVEKGVVRNVKAYGERPGETFQKAAWRIAPMILHGLVGSGAIAAWILKANDGDEEKVLSGPMSDVYRYARDAQRAYQNCSNYVRENYHVTPLMTDGYTSVILGMPLTDEERLLKPVSRFVVDAASVAAGTKESLDVAKALHDATLGVVAPDFKLAGALPTLFDDTVHALWENPEDYYTGGQKYDNDIWQNRNESWEMRGKFSMAMAKRLWNDFGGRNVLPVDRAGVDNGLGRAPGWVAKMVNDIPIASPILRSFVKVQVGSPKRDAAEITDVDNRRRAACRVHAKELFEIARREKRDLSLDRDRYTDMLKKWQQSSEGLTDEELAYIEQHYLNAWRAYEGAQYRADGEREKFRAKAEKLGLEAAHLWLDFD